MPALKQNKQNVYQQGSGCQPLTQTNETCIGKGEDACQTNTPLYIFTRAGHSFFCWDLWCTHFAWNSNTARRMRSPIGSNELPCIARTLFQPCMPTTFCWQDQMSQTKHQYDVSKCCNLIGRNINTHRNKLDARKLSVGRLLVVSLGALVLLTHMFVRESAVQKRTLILLKCKCEIL